MCLEMQLWQRRHGSPSDATLHETHHRRQMITTTITTGLRESHWHN